MTALDDPLTITFHLGTREHAVKLRHPINVKGAEDTAEIRRVFADAVDVAYKAGWVDGTAAGYREGLTTPVPGRQVKAVLRDDERPHLSRGGTDHGRPMIAAYMHTSLDGALYRGRRVRSSGNDGSGRTARQPRSCMRGVRSCDTRSPS